MDRGGAAVRLIALRLIALQVHGRLSARISLSAVCGCACHRPVLVTSCAQCTQTEGQQADSNAGTTIPERSNTRPSDATHHSTTATQPGSNTATLPAFHVPGRPTSVPPILVRHPLLSVGVLPALQLCPSHDANSDGMPDVVPGLALS